MPKKCQFILGIFKINKFGILYKIITFLSYFMYKNHVYDLFYIKFYS